MNLTTPALILYNDELPNDKTARNHYMKIEEHLQSYKQSFADEAIWAVLSTRLSKILELVRELLLLIHFYVLILYLFRKYMT